MTSQDRSNLMDRLVAKAGGVRSEATIQSDVRLLLLDADLGLDDVQLETQVGPQHKRIDVEAGCTVIEVKKSLASSSAIDAATSQLTGYVVTRQAEMGQRYVGMLTDGSLWIAFHEVDGRLAEATRYQATRGEAGATALLRWLEGVLATKTAVRPTPLEIHERLGAGSSSHALDFASLKAMYDDHKNEPTVVLKRQLWANLLRSALGTQFDDDDSLFLEHTLLVNSAEIIAHLVLDLPVAQLSPATLLSGDQFTTVGLYGVVDRDFFDWVLEVPGGAGFVSSLARRLSRFDWSAVEHDVLEVLYESVIKPDVRKSLGEYYTPDWLANRVVQEVVTDPLHQRVLDPSCGSGTFVFYAVRRFLEAADEIGMPLAESMARVSSQVLGIDLHPVAVALARVTYLLALGRDRLASGERGTLSVPVYLGDSLGWHQSEDLLSVDMLVIPTEVGDQFFSEPLRFPEHLLQDAARFDDLVEALVKEAGRASGTMSTGLSAGTIRRLALSESDLLALNANFMRLKQLHEDNRNHIWSYYIRNVSRPAWLSRKENRVDVLVGNPPWLSYRHMTPEMQREFKALSRARHFWRRENTATHQDLAGVFVARAVERYLQSGGRLAFVVPNSVIDREYWSGFRLGIFEGARVQFGVPWDLRRVRPHMFPRGSAVIFGRRSDANCEMPKRAVLWKGRAPRRHAALDYATGLRQSLEPLSIGNDEGELSPYHPRFAQGAILVPRLLFRVQQVQASALGVPGGTASIKSVRSATEKRPWKPLPDMTGTVERQFLYPTFLGEHVLPFRTLKPDTFVIPLTGKGDLMSGEDPKINAYPRLAQWMRNAEAVWNQHGTGNLTLTEQLDYMGKLTQQVPTPATRVVYATAGMHVAAAMVKDQRAIIDSKLYWAAVSSDAEGYYLTAILSSPIVTVLVRPLMSYGKDERDIHKHVWKLPIPLFDPNDDIHLEISRSGQELTETLAERDLISTYFVTARQDFRQVVGQRRQLNDLVAELLGEGPMEAEGAPGGTGLLRLTSGSLGLESADVEIDLDIEFDHDHRVYLWGFLVSDLATSRSTYTSVGSSAADFNTDALARAFLEKAGRIVQEAKDRGASVRLYHYGDVEPLYLSKALGTEADGLLAIASDLLSTIRQNCFSGIGFGLKRLAPLAGFSWRDEGMTGGATYDLIGRAREGDCAAWDTLIRYNEDDTRATKTLRDWLRGGADKAEPQDLLKAAGDAGAA